MAALHGGVTMAREVGLSVSRGSCLIARAEQASAEDGEAKGKT